MKKYIYVSMEIFILLILINDFYNVFGSNSMKCDERYFLHLTMVKKCNNQFSKSIDSGMVNSLLNNSGE